MGVLGLSPFLQKTCPQVIKVINDRFKSLSGKTVAIDATLITQRLHFAAIPIANRHILGWYRLLRELREAGVNAICVFDGQERGIAKQQENERRKRMRKLEMARGSMEIDRLRRLNHLMALLKQYRSLPSPRNERSIRILRNLINKAEYIVPPPHDNGISQRDHEPISPTTIEIFEAREGARPTQEAQEPPSVAVREPLFKPISPTAIETSEGKADAVFTSQETQVSPSVEGLESPFEPISPAVKRRSKARAGARPTQEAQEPSSVKVREPLFEPISPTVIEASEGKTGVLFTSQEAQASPPDEVLEPSFEPISPAVKEISEGRAGTMTTQESQVSPSAEVLESPFKPISLAEDTVEGGAGAMLTSQEPQVPPSVEMPEPPLEPISPTETSEEKAGATFTSQEAQVSPSVEIPEPPPRTVTQTALSLDQDKPQERRLASSLPSLTTGDSPIVDASATSPKTIEHLLDQIPDVEESGPQNMLEPATVPESILVTPPKVEQTSVETSIHTSQSNASPPSVNLYEDDEVFVSSESQPTFEQVSEWENAFFTELEDFFDIPKNTYVEALESVNAAQPYTNHLTFETRFNIDVEESFEMVSDVEARLESEQYLIEDELVSLFQKYEKSMTALLFSTNTEPPPSEVAQEADEQAAQEHYAMSKYQMQLAIDEGNFWASLANQAQKELQLGTEDTVEILVQRSESLSKSYERRNNPPTQQTYDESKLIIQAMGIPCIESVVPYEAEGLAASLVHCGLADFVASEDTDVLIYEAPLLRNIANKQGPLTLYSAAEIREVLQLNRESYVDFALLLGTDFSQRIKNIGPHRAIKLIRSHGRIEDVLAKEPKITPRIPPEAYLEQVQLARMVFKTLPPVPSADQVKQKEMDEAQVIALLDKFSVYRAALAEWDYSSALDGNYFNDNPAVT